MTSISLGIPIYNASAFLDGLFACLRALDPMPDEIILLDDASQDDSWQQLQEFGKASGLRASVHILGNERNVGIAGTYNRLVREAGSEWLQILDGDDVLVESDYYARVQQDLIADNDLVVTGLESNSALLRRGSHLFRWLVPHCAPQWWPLLGSFATRSGIVYRRQLLIENPFVDPMYPGSDVIHLLDLRGSGRCVYLPKPRVFHRVHDGSQSSRSRDYTEYRRQLRRFGVLVRLTYGMDITLRQMGHRWSR